MIPENPKGEITLSSGRIIPEKPTLHPVYQDIFDAVEEILSMGNNRVVPYFSPIKFDLSKHSIEYYEEAYTLYRQAAINSCLAERELGYLLKEAVPDWEANEDITNWRKATSLMVRHENLKMQKEKRTAAAIRKKKENAQKRRDELSPIFEEVRQKVNQGEKQEGCLEEVYFENRGSAGFPRTFSAFKSRYFRYLKSLEMRT